MSPASVGLCMAGFGLLNGIFQFFAFPYFVARFGPRRVLIASTLCYLPIYLLFPFENLAMRHSGRGGRIVAGLLIILQLVLMMSSDMGFSESPATSYSVLRTVTKVVRIPPRHDIHVLVLCRAQQAVSRRFEWSRADDGLDPARGRTSGRLVAVCILTAQQYIGGELCMSCCSGLCGSGWASLRSFRRTCGSINSRYMGEEVGRVRSACAQTFCTILDDLKLYSEPTNYVFMFVLRPISVVGWP